MSKSLIYNSPFWVTFLHYTARLYLKLAGWKVVGEVPSAKKFVAIAAPHTSNWDFPAFFSIVGHFRLSVRFLAKDTLFKGAGGWLFPWLGGIPVMRGSRSASDLVTTAVASFADADEMILAIAPEGTRSSVTKWKTGFYRIAVAADVPILLAYLDSSTREIGLSHLFYPTGDMEADMAEIQAFYAGKRGIQPRNQEDI
ncbi:acyltransferase [Kordiimonas sediminis]|uniref:Acyltransferase n=1 Tax=Kordiimonas sediminis TaxID=1735581 RepID=A0A919E9P1_9PROT|nr:lysophospholipid acyltransferase family protein [Kordiimonas sediminis]GHF26595.1 acyltransferase [Kordiimonas sediminis]